jgi:hypothetical protein
MPEEITTGVHRLPATVYPGVFPGEYQVTIQVAEDREININVGRAFVEIEEEPSEEGINGFLKVQILRAENGTFLVALPGEVQGESSRVQVTREAFATA